MGWLMFWWGFGVALPLGLGIGASWAFGVARRDLQRRSPFNPEGDWERETLSPRPLKPDCKCPRCEALRRGERLEPLDEVELGERFLAASKDEFQQVLKAEGRKKLERLARCKLAPKGWRCKRAAGHEGSCAAIEFHEPAAGEAKFIDPQKAFVVFPDAGLGFEDLCKLWGVDENKCVDAADPIPTDWNAGRWAYLLGVRGDGAYTPENRTRHLEPYAVIKGMVEAFSEWKGGERRLGPRGDSEVVDWEDREKGMGGNNLRT